MDGNEPIIRGLVALAAALCGALTLTPLARRLAAACGVVDRPDGARKLQKQPTPLLGGPAVLASLLAALLLVDSVWPLDARWPLGAWSAGLALLCLVGVCDDIWNLPAKTKLAWQLLCIVPLLASGATIDCLGFCGQSFPLGSWGMLLAAAWFVACINAVNLIDGMDGLASTAGICISLGIALMGAVAGAYDSAIAACALAGALAGFLKYNRPPATIYLGDAGSMVIGLALGLFSLAAATDQAGRTSLTLMSVLMAVPLGDMLLAIVRRKLSGRGIWSADRGHMHHRLLDQGFRTSQVLAIIAGVVTVSSLIAGVSRIVGWDSLAWCASGSLAMALVQMELMGHHEWSLTKGWLGQLWGLPDLRLPEHGELEKHSFEGNLTRLFELLEPTPVHRVELALERSSRQTRQAYDLQAVDASLTSLTLESRHDLGDDASYVLRFVLSESAPVSRRQWLHMRELLKRFSWHWANAVEASPLDEPAILSHPAWSEGERRAA